MIDGTFQDSQIERKYGMLSQEMDRVGLERRNVLQRTEDLKKKMKSVTDQLQTIEQKKEDLVMEDQLIEQECESIHRRFEKLRKHSIHSKWYKFLIYFLYFVLVLKLLNQPSNSLKKEMLIKQSLMVEKKSSDLKMNFDGIIEDTHLSRWSPNI